MDVERDKEVDLKKLADRVIDELFFDDSCESGTPMLSDKRPFGNSDVESDILNIIGWTPVSEEDNRSEYQEQREYAGRLYREEVVPYIKRRWAELI